VSRLTARWRARGRALGEQWQTWRGEWALERELEEAVAGSEPILVGPWLSEVGYEVLYWAPFVRWVAAAYRIPESRFVVMSRGGTASWYRGTCSRYLEIFEHIGAGELAARAAAGDLKQRQLSDLDHRLIDAAAAVLGVKPRVLHPSLLFRWFAPFWSGRESLSFVERQTRYVHLAPPDVPLPLALPRDYVAVKFYAARSLPDTVENRAQVDALVAALAARHTVVQLDTGLQVDDHADYRATATGGVISLNQALDPASNLATQTRIIAGARMFVGTCGSLAWLAPLLGVDTVPVFTDASFLHAHLHVARRTYGRVSGAGRFSPVDLAGLQAAGLQVSGAAVVPEPR
jgi:hypothetical protein